MKSTSHILLHARNSMTHSLRSGSGVAFVVLATIVGLFIASLVFMPIELDFVEADEYRSTAAKAVGFVLSMATLQPGDPRQFDNRLESGDLIELAMWAQYLVLERPVLLSLTVLLLALVLPLLLPLGSFASISGDVQHRSIRYLLPRSTRTSLVLGRLLGALVLTWVVLTFLQVAIVLYLGIVLPLDGWEPLAIWGLQTLGVLLILSFPYVALGVLCSTIFRAPMVALMGAIGLTVAVPIVAFSAWRAWEPLGNLLYLLPWGYAHNLLSPDSATVTEAVFLCTAHGAIFTILAVWRLKRMDL